MSEFFAKIIQAFVMAGGMFWEVGWSLVLGFLISALLQVFISKQRMQQALGRNGMREITLASLYGAASSSCSYASASITRTLFKKGAALIPSLAFMFASTNLVIELGIVLYLLMGWQFMLAEWLGGIVLIGIMALLVRLIYPTKLIEEARHHPELNMSWYMDADSEQNQPAKIGNAQTRIRIAQNFTLDLSMLWKDLLAGFLIAGLLAAFVPVSVWDALFLRHSPGWIQLPANAMTGIVIAVLSFVCSIGNVPMAAVLWGSGISFGGVLAFIYADLVVLPLLDVYRRYYGWKMAAYIAAIFVITMILAALIMDAIFTGLGFVPASDLDIRAKMTSFAFNYTFWLNLVFSALALYLFVLARRNPPAHPGHVCCHGG